MKAHSFVLSLFFTVSFVPGSVAEIDTPLATSSEIHETLQKALEANYRLEWENALTLFKSLEHAEKDHPVIAFGIALTQWWRLSVLALELDKAESEPFLKSAEHALDLARAYIKRGDSTGEGHLVEGATIGLMARWHTANRNWSKAYFQGRRAIAALRRAKRINPQLTDANLGLGIFHYYVAKLPGVVRALAFLGSSGNPRKGLDELTEGVRSSYFSREACRFMLVKIYLKMERNPKEALAWLDDLTLRFPESAYVRSLRGIALYNLHDPVRLIFEAAEQRSLLDSGQLPALFSAQVSFFEALARIEERDWVSAVFHLERGIQKGNEMDPFWLWCHVFLGKTNDILRKREKALEHYRFVLSRLERWESHSIVRGYIKRPFEGKDNELETMDF